MDSLLEDIQRVAGVFSEGDSEGGATPEAFEVKPWVAEDSAPHAPPPASPASDAACSGFARPALSVPRSGRGCTLLSCGDVEANPGPGGEPPPISGATPHEAGPPLLDDEMVPVSQTQEQPLEHPSQHMVLDVPAANDPAALEFLVNSTAAQLRSIGVEPDLPALRMGAQTALAGGLPPLPAILGTVPTFPTWRPTPSFPALSPGCAHLPVGVVLGMLRTRAFATWSGFIFNRGKIQPPSRFG